LIQISFVNPPTSHVSPSSLLPFPSPRHTHTQLTHPKARFCGILRGQESFAQAVSFGLNTRNWYAGNVPLGVNTILLALSVYPTYLVVRDHVPDETDKWAAERERERLGEKVVSDEESLEGQGVRQRVTELGRQSISVADGTRLAIGQAGAPGAGAI